MKKVFLLILLLVLVGCEVGKLKPEREKLYKIGNDICERDPSKCINGVPW